MARSNYSAGLRPLVVVVWALVLTASSLLLSASQAGSPSVSGYGIDRGSSAKIALR